MTVSMKRSRLRRRALTSRIRTLIAHVHLESVDAVSDEEGEDGAGAGTVAAPADRPLEDDDGYERVLRERRRRHFTRLCVEQLYRFEEA